MVIRLTELFTLETLYNKAIPEIVGKSIVALFASEGIKLYIENSSEI